MSGVKITKDIMYAQRGETGMTLDIYAPEGAEAFPLVIFVHGGGWQAGDKASGAVWGQYLAQRGIGLAAVKYRLAMAGKAYPEALEDIREALAFLRKGADSMGCDPRRIGLFGGSAGAQLVALAGLTGKDATAVKLVVCGYGIYDMLTQWEHETKMRPRNNLVETYLGAPPMDDRRLYFEASPLSHAISANRRVKFLLTWGLQDDVVEPSQSLTFMRALEQAGFFARSLVLPEAGHYWLSDPIDEPHSFSGRFAPTLLRFLQTWL